jgi:hypothetical protein
MSAAKLEGNFPIRKSCENGAKQRRTTYGDVFNEFPQEPGRKTEKARRKHRSEPVNYRDVITWVDGDRICFCNVSQQQSERYNSSNDGEDVEYDDDDNDDDNDDDDEPRYENEPVTNIDRIPEELRQARQRREFHEEDGTNKPVSGFSKKEHQTIYGRTRSQE